jgi:YggT family protein
MAFAYGLVKAARRPIGSAKAWQARPTRVRAAGPAAKGRLAGPGGGMSAVFWLIDTIIELVILVLIINAVLSWLIAFDVVNRRNQFVNGVWDFTQRVTDPLLRPIRKVIPLIGGIDLSPMVLILGLLFIQRLVWEARFHYAGM